VAGLKGTASSVAKNSSCLLMHQQGVCHTVALPFTLKKYLKVKEKLWKLKYFAMQKYIIQKNL
jgi:hypothetical protein